VLVVFVGESRWGIADWEDGLSAACLAGLPSRQHLGKGASQWVMADLVTTQESRCVNFAKI
jgi:hypothetical protein